MVNAQSEHSGERAGAASPDELLASALWHTSLGWLVFRCKPGGKEPDTPNGFYAASNDQGHIHRAWAGGRPYNPAVVTGYPGPDILDIDVRPTGNGWAAFDKLKRAGLLTGAHRLVRTRSGGLHLYFAGTSQRCGSLKGLHVDFKAAGGYVLVPPSFVDAEHTDDGIAGSYELVDDRPPTGATFDWQAAKRLLNPPRPVPVRRSLRSGPGAAKHLVGWLEGETEGNRNKALFWASCCALEAGDEAIISELAAVAIASGLGNDEVHKTIESAYRKVGNGDDSA